jgi:hypothetical protein
MPDKEFIFRQAQRIYDDCVTSQRRETMPQDAGGITESYNDLLEQAQEAFTDNDIIQSLEEVQTDSPAPRMNIGTGDSVQRVKSKITQIADALDIELSDVEDAGDRDTLRPIEVSVNQDVDQSQQQEQSQQQYVDIDEVRDGVDRAAMPPDEKQQLQEIIDEFEAELEGDRDSSRLQQLLGRAEEYSVDVVAKLGMLGLQYGVTGLVTSGSA